MAKESELNVLPKTFRMVITTDTTCRTINKGGNKWRGSIHIS